MLFRSGTVIDVMNPLPGTIGGDVSSASCFISDQIVAGMWIMGCVVQGGTTDRLMLYPLGTTSRWSLSPVSGSVTTAAPTNFTLRYRSHFGDAATTINTNVYLNWSTGTTTTLPVTVNVAVAAPEARNLNPVVFALNGAYPNPFNPTTTIKFSLATYSNIKLELYDVNGRKVAELLNASLPAGTHRIGFKATNMASGTYFVKMNAGNFNAVSKILFLK